MNSNVELKKMELRRRDLIRQARLAQLAQEARRSQPDFTQRILVLLSDLMITSGTKLRQVAHHPGSVRPVDNVTEQPDWIASLSR